MKEFSLRTFWGILFVVVLLGAIFAGPYTFALLFLAISALTLKELFQLAIKSGLSPQVIPGTILGAMLFILSFVINYYSLDIKLFYLLVPILFSIPVYELYRKKENPLINIAVTISGILYISVPFSLLNFFVLSADSATVYNYSLLISVFVFIWSSDSGAYLIGINFGRNRLFERISPRKSWEGFFGGLLTSIIAAWLLSHVFTQYSMQFLVSLSVVTVIAGTLGDLVESMIKRSVGVKDSGHFMPGHGGLLDRFDSLLLVSPSIFFILQFLS